MIYSFSYCSSYYSREHRKQNILVAGYLEISDSCTRFIFPNITRVSLSARKGLKIPAHENVLIWCTHYLVLYKDCGNTNYGEWNCCHKIKC